VSSQRKPRYDGYGREVPALSEARQESLLDRPTNREAMARIQAMLQQRWQEVLRRGQHVTISLTFDVQDGVIQQDIKETLVKTYK
jgi:hypothetical protein